MTKTSRAALAPAKHEGVRGEALFCVGEAATMASWVVEDVSAFIVDKLRRITDLTVAQRVQLASRRH